MIGKSRATVSNLIRLNQLHDEVKRLVESKQLEMGHARALLVLPAEQQIACAEVMVKKHLTVRQAEALVKRWLNNEEKKEPQKLNLDEEVEQQLSIIAQRLKAPMAIQLQANGKGRVVIDFTDQEQLTHLLKQLDTIAQ